MPMVKWLIPAALWDHSVRPYKLIERGLILQQTATMRLFSGTKFGDVWVASGGYGLRLWLDTSSIYQASRYGWIEDGYTMWRMDD